MRIKKICYHYSRTNKRRSTWFSDKLYKVKRGVRALTMTFSHLTDCLYIDRFVFFFFFSIFFSSDSITFWSCRTRTALAVLQDRPCPNLRPSRSSTCDARWCSYDADFIVSHQRANAESQLVIERRKRGYYYYYRLTFGDYRIARI